MSENCGLGHDTEMICCRHAAEVIRMRAVFRQLMEANAPGRVWEQRVRELLEET